MPVYLPVSSRHLDTSRPAMRERDYSMTGFILIAPDIHPVRTIEPEIDR
ncbi:MAG TPA: hypothetical protein PLP19_00675 [bacterium]|nr:hypothetical protein [bacterium]HPN41978.1 hypothetical protein [bacterium]